MRTPPITPASTPEFVRGGVEIVGRRDLELEARIVEVARSQPGCQSYENRRPISVSRRFAGLGVLEFLLARFPHLSREHWEADIARGRLLWEGRRPCGPDEPVHGGTQLLHVLPGTIEPAVATNIVVLDHGPEHVAIAKPAPLPIHACGRFHRNCLAWFLREACPGVNFRNCHRLDADTTGVVMYAKTRALAAHLGRQFEARSVEKIYVARVHGWPRDDTWRCEAPVSADSRVAGTRAIDERAGRHALTEVRVRQRFADQSALVELRPTTGRTHQLRLHLARAGHPIVGDPCYVPGMDESRALVRSGICLHAWALAVEDPEGRAQGFCAPWPAWCRGQPANGS